MADKLEWMNKHFVLFRHLTLKEAVEKEAYKLRPDLAEFAPEGISSADFLWNLYHAEKWKEACDFMAYVLHRRAAVWWGYRCLLTLQEELDVAPAVERDIADIGAPHKMNVPDWAKMPSQEEMDKLKEKALKDADPYFKKIQADIAEMQKLIPPEIQKIWDQAYGVVNGMIKKECGMTLEELVKEGAERAAEPPFKVDSSQLEVAIAEMKAKIEAQRKETVDLLKSVIPPKMPDHQKKLRDNAMQAIYRWVAAPDEVNSAAAMSVGDACPDQPAGLMALATYWSFGDLMPNGKVVIPTPPGLAANGICASLLQAALAKGGTRKYKERCKLYADLGLKVAWGEDNWAESLEKKSPPHEQENAAPGVPNEKTEGFYRKWTPFDEQNKGKK